MPPPHTLSPNVLLNEPDSTPDSFSNTNRQRFRDVNAETTSERNKRYTVTHPPDHMVVTPITALPNPPNYPVLTQYGVPTDFSDTITLPTTNTILKERKKL